MITDFPVVTVDSKPRPILFLLELLQHVFIQRHESTLRIYNNKKSTWTQEWCGICNSIGHLERLNRINYDEVILLKQTMFKYRPQRTFKFWTDEFKFYWHDSYERYLLKLQVSPPMSHFWWKNTYEGYLQRVAFIEYLIEIHSSNSYIVGTYE